MRTALTAAVVVLAGVACTSSTETDPIEVCFVRGTRVRTPSGTKPIETLAVGDAVLSFHPRTMAIVVRHVTALHVARAPRVHTISVAGRHVVATDAHPFWEAEKRAWVRAADLERGAVLAVMEDGKLVPRSIDATSESNADVEVFNITVEGPEHTYFAEDIAVHNKSVAPPCCVEPNDSTFGPTGITILNDSEIALPIRVLSLPNATIDERVLTRELDFEIPESSVDLPMLQNTVLPKGVHTIDAPIQVIGKEGPLTPRTGAVIQLGTERALYVGSGILRTRRVDGVIQLVPRDATKIRVVRISKDLPTCTTDKSPLKYDSLTSADMSSPYEIGAITRDEEGCTKLRLDSQLATVSSHDIRFCAADEAFPFTVGETVSLRPPVLLAASTLGLRLERADKKAFEVAIMERPGPLFTASSQLKLAEDTSCILPLDPSSQCKELRLRATATPAEKITIPGGHAWVAGATSSPFSLECATPRGARIAVVARSSP